MVRDRRLWLLAAVIAALFFPAQDASTSLLLTFGSFGLTFLSRPLGAVLLGVYADRFGRKTALQLSIWMMVAASAAIAFVPTYDSIGIAAPAIVVLSRLLQGFAVGGEFGSATAFLAEQDPARRGYFASWQFASQGLTGLLATGFATALTLLLSAEDISAWGWRLPFLFGLLLYPIGIYIRGNLTETPEFRAAQAKSGRLRLAAHWRAFAIAIGLIVLGTVAVYTIIFLPTYAVRSLHLPAADGFITGVITSILQLTLIPMFGALSDRIGLDAGADRRRGGAAAGRLASARLAGRRSDLHQAYRAAGSARHRGQRPISAPCRRCWPSCFRCGRVARGFRSATRSASPSSAAWPRSCTPG